MIRYRSPREGSTRARAAEASGARPGAYAAMACGKEPGAGGRLLGRRPFKWVDIRSLWVSRNDRVAASFHDPVEDLRRRWLAWSAHASGGELADDALLVQVDGGDRASCLIMGDTGEGDASQCAVVPQLLAAAPGTALLFICGDVVYPVGDVNDYRAKFYEPYAEYPGRIYAVPSNHDWYDQLEGFMFHLCGIEAPPEDFEPVRMPTAARWLWRRPRKPKPPAHGARDGMRASGRPFQPWPYFAIDLGPILVVGIETGIRGELDRRQGEWLRRVSAGVDKPKVLLSGKPIYVDGEYNPGSIAQYNWTVDDIVLEPGHRYVAAIGGDVHNYQRYPVHLPDGRTMLYLVSGGGGAFMHATHRIPLVDLEGVSERGEDPDPETGDGFRCFPLRGDSIAYYTRAVRSGVRQLIRDSALIGAASLAAVVAFLVVLGVQWWTVEIGAILALPALIAALWLLYLARNGAFWLAFGRRARLSGEEGAVWIARKLGLEPTLPGATEIPPERARLADANFPRFHNVRGLVHTFFSEVMDADQPPFFKHFLRLDAEPERLTIRCYAAIGSEAADDPLALEDEIVIDLPQA
jgi:hypothetical protein